MTAPATNDSTCKIVCLLLGLLIAAIVWYFLPAFVGPVMAIILAFLTFLCAAWLLHEFFCKKEGSSSSAVGVAAATTATAAATASLVNTDASGEAEKKEEKAPAKSKSAPKAASASKKSGAKKSTTTAASSSKSTAKRTSAKSAANSKSAPKSTASKTAAKKTAAKKAPAKKAGPERLKKPKGKADDLKMISGVGPKLEKTLNGLGFWHFSQIAKWKKADVSIVDDELSFKGRIERDDWIKQAKALAKGGEAEYIKVFGKKPR